MKRGDVALAFYPFSAGAGGSRRPVLVVQSDVYNRKIANRIVAQITTNLRMMGDPTCFLIEVASQDGAASGLLHDSIVSCINLATLDSSRIDRVIGTLSKSAMDQIDECLKTALAIK